MEILKYLETAGGGGGGGGGGDVKQKKIRKEGGKNGFTEASHTADKQVLCTVTVYCVTFPLKTLLHVMTNHKP